MSIKNQRALIISAATIIGLTAVSLVGLNLIVDHISRLAPPPIAMTEVPPSKMKPSVNDAIERPKGPVEPKAPVEERNKTKIPEAKDRPSDDVLRRVRNGKDAPDIRRTQPPPTKDDSMQNGQRQMPPYPPPYPTDPKERERFEKMMEQYGPPPGYYPPPSGYPPPPSGYPPPGAFPPSPYPDDYNQPYDAPYDYGEQYYDEYEPEYDFNSRFDSTKTNDQKTATFHDERAVDLAADEYPVIDDQDDYIDSDLE